MTFNQQRNEIKPQCIHLHTRQVAPHFGQSLICLGFGRIRASSFKDVSCFHHTYFLGDSHDQELIHGGVACCTSTHDGVVKGHRQPEGVVTKQP